MKSLLLVALTVVVVVSVAAGVASASAAAEDGDDFCSRCDTSGLRYRLVRGRTEAESCEAGRYCDCDRGRAERCFLWPLGRRFNEDAQRCEFSFDCRAWLAGNDARRF